MPMTKIAKKIGVSDKAIKKKCIKLNINKKPRGYWLRQSKNADIV